MLANTAVYQHSLRNYHSRQVRNMTFFAGDLMLRLKKKAITI
jgi:hypothetical protein